MRIAIIILAVCWPAVTLAQSDTPWDGFYGGVKLGVSSAETRVIGNRFTYNQNQAVNLVDHAYDGLSFDILGGWTTQRGDWVLGGEASLGYSTLTSNLVFNADNDIDEVALDWTATLVGRVGRVLGASQVFVKGGLVFARFDNLGGDVNGGALTLSDAHMRRQFDLGAIAGVGWERTLSDDWRLRIEYTRMEFEDYSQANQDGVPGSQVYQVDNGPVETIGVAIIRRF